MEATEVFFATTKLFQSKDAGLRRMVYLMIKELSPSADEVREYQLLLGDTTMHPMECESDFICVLLSVGYHCHQLFDEGHE